jgi:hypothetical protein
MIVYDTARMLVIMQPTSSDFTEIATLIVEPQVFEARAVVDAIDHQGHSLHPRLPAGSLTGIEDDRADVVFGQPLSQALGGLPRLHGAGAPHPMRRRDYSASNI